MVSDWQVRKLMKDVIDQWAWQVEDFLPSELRNQCDLLGLPQAISQAHYPEDEVTKDRARTRLAFDECLFFSKIENDYYIDIKKRDREEIMKIRRECGYKD